MSDQTPATPIPSQATTDAAVAPVAPGAHRELHPRVRYAPAVVAIPQAAAFVAGVLLIDDPSYLAGVFPFLAMALALAVALLALISVASIGRNGLREVVIACSVLLVEATFLCVAAIAAGATS
ncbi:hypothetical protein [Galbitalea soli]|uniref:Uncharacterized protein n=1 Tax=Galbitalea soli TaxID=1268042 RepID=A0A7C9TRJ9_9MICO|nr:hypothetical protein [Galbitalea soli]NEM91382.1 hypothetical protein [Galbitalea soli]NYJ30073.1 hypothetical protein [Galbitalea soli]